MVKHFNFLSVAVVFIVSVLFVSESSAQSRPTYTRRSAHTTEVGDAIMNGISSLFKKKDKKDKKKKDNSTNASPKNVVGENDAVLIVTGDGPTKEKATLSALRSALEQVYGTMVSSNTKILNDELIKDEIVSISTGFVKEYSYMSEKEIAGKHYVVVKAIVSPQKLATFVKQKGGSTELAGATFAANVKLKRLNAKNALIAARNIIEMQTKIFPSCLDFTISGISEPKKEDGLYYVNFTVEVRLNSNAKFIQDLESQKPEYNTPDTDRGDLYNFSFETRNVYPYVRNLPFNMFKIEDNINTYYFDFPYDDIRYVRICKKPIINNQVKYIWLNKKHIYLDNDNRERCEEFYCQSSGKYTSYGYYEDDILQHGQVCWEYMFPNRPIIRIPISIGYTLEDLEKITGINVVLVKKTREDAKTLGFSAEVWQTIMSLNEKEFMEFINYHRQELHKNGTGLSDETLDIIIQEYRKAKNNQ